jgi:hypothetical protein
MNDNDDGDTEGVVIVDDSDSDDDDDNDNIILLRWHSRCRFMSHAPFSPTLCGFSSFLLQFPDHIPICSSVFHPHTSYRGN